VTLGAKLWVAFAVLVAVLLAVAFIHMYLDLHSTFSNWPCMDTCHGKGD